jgi:hypothetical protein
MGIVGQHFLVSESLTDPCNFVLDSVSDPGSCTFLTPGSGMKIPDHISESLETIFWVKNTYLYSLMRIHLFDPGSGFILMTKQKNFTVNKKQFFF